MGSSYENIAIIGYGKIVAWVIKYIYEYQKKYNYTIRYIEHEIEPFGVSRNVCSELGIDCFQIVDKEELTHFLLSIHESCLIISVSNNYIFPSVLTKDPRFTIINFHNALLPKYPGRNAPSWAIFENEKETGITWHYVTEQVDAGKIIVQKECKLDPDVRAYELAEELMKLAYEGFCEKFEEIIENRISTIEQNIAENRKIYKSSDKPGGCKFGENDSAEYIYRLLRAVDYGKYGIFPPVLSTYQGRHIKIVRYRKVSGDKIEEKEGRIHLPLEPGYFLRLSWVVVRENFEGGGITDLEYFYELVAKIKKANRKQVSNYYLAESVLEEAIKRGIITYGYEEGAYLNIYWEKELYKKLYYFIADLKKYKMDVRKSMCVCDVICKESDKDELSCMMTSAGAHEYAAYSKWICRNPILREPLNRQQLKIFDGGPMDGGIDGLYSCFDRICDMLPDKEELDAFIESRNFIGVYDKEVCVGGLVYAKQGYAITEEFVFVVPRYRGKGISKLLHNVLYQKYYGEKIKYIAWIRNDNHISIKLHEGYNYKKQSQLKITFVKGRE